jgi:hypothetical protein
MELQEKLEMNVAYLGMVRPRAPGGRAVGADAGAQPAPLLPASRPSAPL